MKPDYVMSNIWWGGPIFLGKYPEGAKAPPVVLLISTDMMNMPARAAPVQPLAGTSPNWSAKFLYERYGKPLLITENGCACNDWVSLDGKVHDPDRIDFVHRYLLSLQRAIDEGVPVLGHQYWSMIDNFEWASGYGIRFGPVYVDYRTQKRTVKDSAWWYKEIIAANGKNL